MQADPNLRDGVGGDELSDRKEGQVGHHDPAEVKVTQAQKAGEDAWLAGGG